jgi:hypothetical protein
MLRIRSLPAMNRPVDCSWWMEGGCLMRWKALKITQRWNPLSAVSKRRVPSLFLGTQDLNELEAVVNCQMQYYYTQRGHSGLDYLSPLAYIN